MIDKINNKSAYINKIYKIHGTNNLPRISKSWISNKIIDENLNSIDIIISQKNLKYEIEIKGIQNIILNWKLILTIYKQET